jgi:hypothetical protein
MTDNLIIPFFRQDGTGVNIWLPIDWRWVWNSPILEDLPRQAFKRLAQVRFLGEGRAATLEPYPTTLYSRWCKPARARCVVERRILSLI